MAFSEHDLGGGIELSAMSSMKKFDFPVSPTEECKNCRTQLSDFFYHLPPPPMDLLSLGDGASCYVDELAARGYEVTSSAFLENANRGLPEKVFDIIIIHSPSKWLLPLATIIRSARDRLSQNGTLVICDEFPVLESGFKAPQGLYAAKQLITGLYESGFSIRVHNKWRKLSEKRGSGLSNGLMLSKTSDGHPPEASEMHFHMIVGRKSDLYLRSYQKGDEVAILSMFQEVFNAERSVAHWYWKFRDNPFGAYKIVQAVTHSGVLAGHYSGYPVPFYAPSLGEGQVLSLQIGDIMTRPDFRRVGLGKTSVLGRITDYFHHKFCMDHIPFMYGFVAGNHRKFGERFLGYRYMSEIPFHVLDFTPSILKSSSWIKKMFSGIRVEEVFDVGPEYDLLFQNAASHYGLLVKRDISYIRWRYLDCPDGGYRMFALKRFGKVVGWSIFRTRGSVLIWGDALFLKPHASMVRILISEILNQHFPQVRRIEAWFSKNPPWWTNLLRRMGFEIIQEPNGLVAGLTLFDPSLTLKSVEDILYYSMGDSDLF